MKQPLSGPCPASLVGAVPVSSKVYGAQRHGEFQ